MVLCCNEAIHKIETLDLTCPTYVVQQDSHLQDRCVPKRAVHLMSCWQRKKVTVSEWNANAVLYDPCELGFNRIDYTAIAACRLAKYMGMTNIIFVCFDSWLPGGTTEYAKCIDTSIYGGAVRAAPVPKIEIIKQAKEMGLALKAWFPDVEI